MELLPNQANERVEDLCASTGLWPVYFVLSGIRGCTLWGGRDGDDQDVFLVAGDHLLLFESLPALVRDAGVEQHAFSAEPRFAAFLDGAFPALADPAAAPWTIATRDYISPLTDWSARVADPRHHGALVDCMDAALDLATQLGAEDVRADLSTEDSALGRLYEALWRGTEMSPSEVKAAEAAFTELGKWIEGAVRYAP